MWSRSIARQGYYTAAPAHPCAPFCYRDRMRGTFVGIRGAVVVALALAASCKGGGDRSAPPAPEQKQSPEATGPQKGGHIKLPDNEPRFTNPILETRLSLASGLVFE